VLRVQPRSREGHENIHVAISIFVAAMKAKLFCVSFFFFLFFSVFSTHKKPPPPTSTSTSTSTQTQHVNESNIKKGKKGRVSRHNALFPLVANHGRRGLRQGLVGGLHHKRLVLADGLCLVDHPLAHLSNLPPFTFLQRQQTHRGQRSKIRTKTSKQADKKVPLLPPSSAPQALVQDPPSPSQTGQTVSQESRETKEKRM